MFIRSQQLCAWLVAMELCAGIARAGLTHRYSFTDGAKDSVGKIDGKLKGSASVAGGKLVLKNENMTSTDEKLSYVEFAEPILPKGDSASLVFWFTSKDAGGFARLLNIGETTGGEGHAFIYITPRTGEGMARAAMTATDVGGRIFVDNPPLDDDKPHMMAVVIDGKAGKLQVFIDGKETSPAQDLGENTLDKIKQTNSWIGRSSFDADTGLSASIDEFRVYDHALTADEAAALNKAGPDTLPAAK